MIAVARALLFENTEDTVRRSVNYLLSAYIVSVLHSVKADFFNQGIRLIQCVLEISAQSRHAEHAAAVGIKLSVRQLCSGMENCRAVQLSFFIKTGYFDAFPVC